MYRKNSSGWVKHVDFILLDLLCIQLAFYFSYVCRMGEWNPYSVPIYRNMAIFIELADIAVIFLFESYKNVLKRGYYIELVSSIKQAVMLILVGSLYLLSVQEGNMYSRTAFYLMGIFYAVFAYGARILWKRYLKKKMKTGGDSSLIIITSSKIAEKVVKSIKNHNYEMYQMNGVIVLDRDMTGEDIEGVPVVANAENVAEFLRQSWVDEVFINLDEGIPYPKELIERCSEMGLTVHLNLVKITNSTLGKQSIGKVGEYTVLTTSINYMTMRQAFLKRTMDIAAGLAGCIATGIIFVFVAPIIYISSPGPIFFSQERVGQNGKIFKMYKFRSMGVQYPKKEAKEWTTKNDVRFTPVGRVIRKTSLDELPQFWNVLKGDMSLIGPRPERPLFVEKFKEEIPRYMVKHQVRPGITGWAQINGYRGDTSIMKRIEYDLYYIENWTIGLDIKILILTFFKGFINKNAY